jgi:hypothetical protein
MVVGLKIVWHRISFSYHKGQTSFSILPARTKFDKYLIEAKSYQKQGDMIICEGYFGINRTTE